MCNRRLGVILLCVSLFACEQPQSGAPGGASPAMTFLHLNDTYRIDAVEDGQRGGFGRVATIIRDLERQGRNVRILHGGDFLYPSLESQLWGGAQMVEAFNFLDRLAPMYVVPGNHEFDPREPQSLVDALKASEFAWLGDNLSFATGDAAANGYLRSAFMESMGGRSVGIFALTLAVADGGNSRDYAPVDAGYVDHARRVIEHFDAAGADLILGLTHLHLADDIAIAKLKLEYPRFQFVVGGHEHEPEHEAGSASSAEVMKGASNARTIWQIDVFFTDQGMPSISSKMIPVDDSIPLDTEYQVIADKWRSRLLDKLPFLPSKVGVAAVPLDGREVTVRNEESNWGSFIADQMLTAFRDPAADLAFLNSGTLRIDDYVAADITFEDIGRTFGFSSFLRYMTITGADFKSLLEAGFRGAGPSKGYFPQIAGFRVCVDKARPDGDRIVQIMVPDGDAWRAMDANEDYQLVAPDFIYRGGDGYDFSKAREVSRPGSELQYLVLDAILVAQAEGRQIGAAATPKTRRIAFLQPGASRCFD